MNGDLKDIINKKANEKIKKDSEPYLEKMKEDFGKKFEELVNESTISIQYNALSGVEFEIGIKILLE